MYIIDLSEPQAQTCQYA